MRRRLRSLWVRNPKKRHLRTRRLNTECLEHRAMLAATPLGEEMFVTNASTAFSGSDDDAAEVVFGVNGETLTVSHSVEVVGARAAGDDREIFARRFDADGDLIGNPIRVNQLTRGEQSNPAVGTAEDGSFLVVWDGRGEGDRHGIFARRFNADGTAAGDQFLVNTTVGGIQSRPDVAVADDGTAIVTWHGVGDGDAAGVFAQRIAADDALVGSETLVNTETDLRQGYSSVATDADGNYVVAWSSRDQDGDDWGIFAQRFQAEGTPDGEEFAVNTTTTGSQHHADVAMVPDGRFNIVWSSFGQDGDGWGVFTQRFAADGTPIGGETQVNEESDGHQLDASIAVADGGDSVVAWSQGVEDGNGWEVNVRNFDADGVPDGDVVLANQALNGARSGHQRVPSVALDADGRSLIAFQGKSDSNRNGIQQQRFDVDVEPAENLAPSFDNFDDPEEVRVGEMLEVNLRATDPNGGDTLTFELEENPATPDDATLERVNENEVTLRWTPDVSDRGERFSFRILVQDDGEPQLGDSAQFIIDVVNAPPVVDLNGSDFGTDRSISLPEGATEIALLDESLSITDADQDELASATVSLRSFPDLNAESLSVDTGQTNISASYDTSRGRLELTGVASIEEYEDVLRTLMYENQELTGNSRAIEITVNDGDDVSNEAVVTLQISDNQAPTLEEIPPITVQAGSPLHIPLNAIDPDGDALTFTSMITGGNPSSLETSVLEGNRSWRLTVEGSGANAGIQGDMVFELFEGRAPRATERFIELTENGDGVRMPYFEGIIFHRVIDGFVIQGGDPEGDGTGGSAFEDFDDQFHVDLQHNRSGILSMAKSTDDTNDSQFFVTEGPTRSLDFNHTIFGILVAGEEIREAISNVATTPSFPAAAPNNKPLDDITITGAEVFVDNQNGVLMLKAPEGVTGTVNVGVTVTDGNGGTSAQTLTVNIVPDTQNSEPFLRDIPTIRTSTDTVTSFQLTASDVEGDPIFFYDEALLATSGVSVSVPSHPDLDYSVNQDTGLLTITPQNGLTGTHQITVAVASSVPPPLQPNGAAIIDLQVIDVVINDDPI